MQYTHTCTHMQYVYIHATYMGLHIRRGEKRKKNHIEGGSINSYFIDFSFNSGVGGKF